MPSSSILLIDDHALFRSSVALMLEMRLPRTTVSEASRIEQALAQALPAPDLILLDVQLESTNGLEGIALLQERWPLARVVIVSAFDRDAIVREAIQRGAVEFHSKAECPEHLLQRIQALLSGEPPEPRTIAATPLPLTSRQRQVLGLLCRGLTNKEIALQLWRSEHTVRSHVQAILTILQTSCRTEAADAARRLGLVL
ncbi:DNA-binding response regulator [Pseudomonas syringae pv. tomato]|uniref:LuxR family transcriptional regulator n=12 Tax=Pseudomonas TaxID=286 RepID=A0A2K4X3Z5_PSESX|nr:MULTISPECIES: response regulator transcription factor [Pseudomonas syringae group]AAK94468.1 response regulator CorR [Pseudomonas syringae pv. actinidiae]AVB17744.1 DNA-binding response regulator [Pseudomonas amygdali pv. morsprunorum]AVI87951.1 DNA-binding response regulator [Pseudomonas syringae pv. tomato]EFW77575.1 DNA-binding response regulator CorR [Pseudomonas savastanoi pv. glycinea str. B076]EPM60308.1 DNA-binding response regulator CorR [Pseudomonas syringae pv. actinidiae ICMP 19